MKFFKRRVPKNEHDRVRNERGMFPIDTKYSFEPFGTEITIHAELWSESLDLNIVDVLYKSFKEHQYILAQKSYENALTFMEETGEAFHLMFDVADEPEYCIPFMEDFYNGNLNELQDFLMRWFNSDASLNIVQWVFNHKNPSGNTAEDFYRDISNAILALGYEKYNFMNVYPAIKNELAEDSSKIFGWMRLINISIFQYDASKYTADFQFDTDWEEEHGLWWSFNENNPVYVGNDLRSHEEIIKMKTID